MMFNCAVSAHIVRKQHCTYYKLSCNAFTVAQSVALLLSYGIIDLSHQFSYESELFDNRTFSQREPLALKVDTIE